jgi:hypothetical protein
MNKSLSCRRGVKSVCSGLLFLFLSACPMSGLSGDNSVPPKKPFPQTVSYPGDVQFSSRYTRDQMNGHLRSFYDFWKARYLKGVTGVSPSQKFVLYSGDAWDPRWYSVDGVKDSYAITVSEAHGYGMIALVYMAGHDPRAKADFDAMFRFYKAHQTADVPGLMAWQQYVVIPGVEDHFASFDPVAAGDPERAGQDAFWNGQTFIDIRDAGGARSSSATDGDLDIAYALILADRQWGSGSGINYRKEALSILHAILAGCVIPGEDVLSLGSWVDPEDERYGRGTRPSDFMLSHLRAFASFDTANRDRWMAIHDKAVSLCTHVFKTRSPSTGLMPDFLRKRGATWEPALGQFLESDNDGDFYYNACRTPWRLSMDYILYGDESLLEQQLTLNRFIRTESGGRVRMTGNPSRGFINGGGYYVAGGKNGGRIRGDQYDELCYSAPFAVSAMIGGDNQTWYDTLYDAIAVNGPGHAENPGYIDTTGETRNSDYFGNSINLLVLILVTGNWWVP